MKLALVRENSDRIKNYIANTVDFRDHAFQVAADIDKMKDAPTYISKEQQEKINNLLKQIKQILSYLYQTPLTSAFAMGVGQITSTIFGTPWLHSGVHGVLRVPRAYGMSSRSDLGSAFKLKEDVESDKLRVYLEELHQLYSSLIDVIAIDGKSTRWSMIIYNLMKRIDQTIRELPVDIHDPSFEKVKQGVASGAIVGGPVTAKNPINYPR